MPYDEVAQGETVFMDDSPEELRVFLCPVFVEICEAKKKWNIDLRGGFKYFIFSPLRGEMIQFD